MATGRLYTGAPAATTVTPTYIVPTGYYAVINVSITNTNTTPVTVRLAACANPASPQASEYIEYESTIIPRGVLERTGLVLQPNAGMVAYVSTTGVNVNVWGIETSTT
jgi:hypothetical protein